MQWISPKIKLPQIGQRPIVRYDNGQIGERSFTDISENNWKRNIIEWLDESDDDLIQFAEYCGIAGNYNNMGYWRDKKAQTSISTVELKEEFKKQSSTAL